MGSSIWGGLVRYSGILPPARHACSARASAHAAGPEAVWQGIGGGDAEGGRGSRRVVIERDLVACCNLKALMTEPAGERRFRLSIRTLMVAVALCALLLALAVWTVRQAEALRQAEARMRLERLVADQQREAAQAAL